jgi:hypothetical protein
MGASSELHPAMVTGFFSIESTFRPAILALVSFDRVSFQRYPTRLKQIRMISARDGNQPTTEKQVRTNRVAHQNSRVGKMDSA